MEIKTIDLLNEKIGEENKESIEDGYPEDVIKPLSPLCQVGTVIKTFQDLRWDLEAFTRYIEGLDIGHSDKVQLLGEALVRRKGWDS